VSETLGGEEAPVAGRQLTRHIWVHVVQIVEAPAIRAHLGDGVDTVLQKCPKGLGVVGPSGQAATDPNDRDRSLRARSDSSNRTRRSRISSSARLTGERAFSSFASVMSVLLLGGFKLLE